MIPGSCIRLEQFHIARSSQPVFLPAIILAWIRLRLNCIHGLISFHWKSRSSLDKLLLPLYFMLVRRHSSRIDTLSNN